MYNSKKLHEIAAEFILERDISINIKGEEEFLQSYSRLLSESRKLYRLINEGNLEAIKAQAEIKKEATQEFQKISGISWRL
tara:strand:- start:66 stop:308 length:243 start_codon:yes stop_codon:yes gene_type:complete